MLSSTALLLLGTLSCSYALPGLVLRQESSIDFQPCDLPEGQAPPNGTILECAVIPVPLSYDDTSSGKTIQFGFSRFRLREKPANTSLGSLQYNCGGPGGACALSPARSPRSAALYIELLQRGYSSVISIDPRGVGSSTRIKCDPKLWNEYVSITPTNEQEYKQLVDNNVALAKSCRELSGDLLTNVDTISAARDIDKLRAALGDEKLNYLGASYGTQLGHQYAYTFPKNVGRIVLDGPLDHSVEETSMVSVETRGLQDVFDAFVAYCEANSTCALHGQDVRGVWHQALDAIKTTPAQANLTECPTCKVNVTYSDVMRTMAGLFIQPSFNALASGIAALAKGDGTTFAPTLANGTDDPAYSAFAIQCQDWAAKTRSLGDLRARMNFTAQIGMDALQATQSYWILATCIGYPYKIKNPQQAIYVNETVPSPLIVARTRDPSTAYEWGIGMRHQIPSSHLLTIDGGVGHTSFGRNGTATRLIMDFLTGDSVPEDNLHIGTEGELY